jgi:Zn-dependent alcohol dehydrogenase
VALCAHILTWKLGAGIVVEGGSKVNEKPGDSVLLSFAYCGSCEQCSTKHPAYRESFVIVNYVGGGGVFKSFDGTDIAGTFFGQSSFSNLTLVAESSVVNVSRIINSEDELKLFAPLGCGFQTGMCNSEHASLLRISHEFTPQTCLESPTHKTLS